MESNEAYERLYRALPDDFKAYLAGKLPAPLPDKKKDENKLSETEINNKIKEWAKGNSGINK